MRQLVITSLEKIMWIFGGLMVVAGLLAGLTTMFTTSFWMGLLILVFTPVYAILFLGMFFVILATQENTKRTAEAVENLASR